MNKGIKTVLYPVKDMGKAKAMFSKLLGVAPIADTAYYVGFKVGDQDIGLIPTGQNKEDGVTAYYTVDDIKKSLQSLVDAGAQVLQEIKDVGGGRQVASVKDADRNIIGLSQDIK
jgi:predicted enzyme related to lactoylglutathione lyase